MPDPISPVVNVITDAAPSTTAATIELIDAVTPAVAGAVAGTVSKAGWLTVSAATAGLALNVWNSYKTANTAGKEFDVGSVFGSTTVAIGVGAGLLIVGEKALIGRAFLPNVFRGAGIALVLGGLAGAVMGAVRSVGGVGKENPASGSSQWQPNTKFEAMLPAAPASLRGIKVGTADIITGKRDPKYVSMYLDPTTATPLVEGTTLADAIALARRSAQSDAEFRSFAVIKTSDESLWTIRLSGELDQIDGMNYTKDNTFNPSYHPNISRHQQSLQAIAGVEELYVFPQNADPTEPEQDTGNIPWLIPDIPNMPATPTPVSIPAPAPTPAPDPATDPAAPAAGG